MSHDACPRKKSTHNFGHVQNDDGGLKTDTDTRNETTSDDGTESMFGAGDHLNNDTDHVDKAADNDSPLSADPIRDVTSSESTEEGTGRQDGGDESLVALSKLLRTDAVDGLDEDLGALDTVNVSRIITEENTTKGGKGTHHVGLPCDGSLDIFDGLRSLKTDMALGVLVIGGGSHCDFGWGVMVLSW